MKIENLETWKQARRQRWQVSIWMYSPIWDRRNVFADHNVWNNWNVWNDWNPTDLRS